MQRQQHQQPQHRQQRTNSLLHIYGQRVVYADTPCHANPNRPTRTDRESLRLETGASNSESKTASPTPWGRPARHRRHRCSFPAGSEPSPSVASCEGQPFCPKSVPAAKRRPGTCRLNQSPSLWASALPETMPNKIKAEKGKVHEGKTKLR